MEAQVGVSAISANPDGRMKSEILIPSAPVMHVVMRHGNTSFPASGEIGTAKSLPLPLVRRYTPVTTRMGYSQKCATRSMRCRVCNQHPNAPERGQMWCLSSYWSWGFGYKDLPMNFRFVKLSHHCQVVSIIDSSLNCSGADSYVHTLLGLSPSAKSLSNNRAATSCLTCPRYPLNDSACPLSFGASNA